jgi:hypothetical protein
MKEIQTQLIVKAMEKYGWIKPCSNKNSLSECFTVESDKVLFWFNTSDNNTHILTAEAV